MYADAADFRSAVRNPAHVYPRTRMAISFPPGLLCDLRSPRPKFILWFWLLLINPVGVEKVRDRNVFSAAMIAAA